MGAFTYASRLFPLAILCGLMILPACGAPTIAPTPLPPGIYRIAYNSDGIALVNSNGTGFHRLVEQGGDPAWSSDGRFIAFGYNDIYVVSSNGGEPAFVATIETGSLYSLAWSPDGKHIAFSAIDGRGGGEIFLTTIENTPDGLAGQKPTVLENGLDAYGLTWSPDSKYLAFSFRRDLHDLHQVGLLDAAPRLLITIAYSYSSPTWSPDSAQVVVASRVLGDETALTLNLFNTADLIRDKGFTHPIDLTPDTVYDSSPTWSPDGTRIAFVSYRDDDAEIYVMNADGGNQTQLTDNAAEDFDPAWSPDGKQIAFVSDRDGNREIYVMNADGSNQARLTNNDRDDWGPVWQPRPSP